MFLFYDLIFFIFAIFYLPAFLLKRKMHPGFAMRLGILPPDFHLNNPVWIHAVSVGEAVAIKQLVDSLRIDFPKKSFIISTVTATGNKIAKEIAGPNDRAIYLPLDFSFIVKRVIDRANPAVFVIAETEIWPNLIRYLFKKNIPVIVVNGRISDKSFKGYRRIRFLLKPLLNKISAFCVQTETDRQRLIVLGMREERIKVTGNMKFDLRIRDYTELKKDYTDYRLGLGLGVKDKFLVCASTHPGEEKILLEIYKQLLDKNPSLKLLIAPRHPERAKEIEQLAAACGFKPVRMSSLSAKATAGSMPQVAGRTEHGVFILDTIGQLMYFYAIADVVFVGGSLVKKGGHNILEPASLGKPIVFGCHMFNFRDICRLFMAAGAGIMVSDKEQLQEQISGLLSNEHLRSELGARAKKFIQENQGATMRNRELIKKVIIR
jgi:3-deoxy-D-manno-octulosonic-acid transferase